jgi:DNA-binding transcriptional MerR regulator/DNA-binding PadR family transcriptional regulator
MTGPVRVTGPLLDVLEVFLQAFANDEELHGWAILKATKRAGPTVYGVLDRLEDAGWVTGRWEDQPPNANTPRRRLYRLTPGGVVAARDLLASRRPAALTPAYEAATARLGGSWLASWPGGRYAVTRGEMVFAIVSGLLVNECCDISPWVAVPLMRWATRLRYRGAAERASVRGEELAALIQDRPGNLFKLLTAFGFTLHAVLVAALRSAPGVVKRAAKAARGQRRHLPLGYRGPTVSELVGISYRRLDYWARTGLVTPSVRAADGSGSQGLYSFTDVVELRIIKRLQDAGVSLRQIRTALGYLRQESGGMPLTDVTLLSDGHRIYACRSREDVMDVFSKGQAVFGIAVGRVWADTEGDLAHLALQNGMGAALLRVPIGLG